MITSYDKILTVEQGFQIMLVATGAPAGTLQNTVDLNIQFSYTREAPGPMSAIHVDGFHSHDK